MISRQENDGKECLTSGNYFFYAFALWGRNGVLGYILYYRNRPGFNSFHFEMWSAETEIWHIRASLGPLHPITKICGTLRKIILATISIGW